LIDMPIIRSDGSCDLYNAWGERMDSPECSDELVSVETAHTPAASQPTDPRNTSLLQPLGFYEENDAGTNADDEFEQEQIQILEQILILEQNRQKKIKEREQARLRAQELKRQFEQAKKEEEEKKREEQAKERERLEKLESEQRVKNDLMLNLRTDAEVFVGGKGTNNPDEETKPIEAHIRSLTLHDVTGWDIGLYTKATNTMKNTPIIEEKFIDTSSSSSSSDSPDEDGEFGTAHIIQSNPPKRSFEVYDGAGFLVNSIRALMPLWDFIMLNWGGATLQDMMSDAPLQYSLVRLLSKNIANISDLPDTLKAFFLSVKCHLEQTVSEKDFSMGDIYVKKTGQGYDHKMRLKVTQRYYQKQSDETKAKYTVLEEHTKLDGERHLVIERQLEDRDLSAYEAMPYREVLQKFVSYHRKDKTCSLIKLLLKYEKEETLVL
jgi:hypothetical protein